MTLKTRIAALVAAAGLALTGCATHHVVVHHYGTGYGGGYGYHRHVVVHHVVVHHVHHVVVHHHGFRRH